MKIVSTGSSISSLEFYEKRRKARRKKGVIILILSSLLSAGLIGVSYIRAIRINEVTVSGNKAIITSDVEKTIRELLNEKYWMIVPKDNAFIYPKEDLMEVLSSKYPRFSSIELNRDGLKKISVKVTEREPYALYCGEALSPEETNVCYFLDETGYIFDIAPSFSNGVYFVFAEANPSAALKRDYLPQETFVSLRKFIGNLEKLGLRSTAITLDSDNYELKLSGGGVLTWKRGSDFGEVYTNIESFLNEKSIKSDKTFISRVIELDFGTENKVFYKLRE